MMKQIFIKDIYGSELLSRANVKKLYHYDDIATAVVDFSGVDFISRSAADEICNLVEEYPGIAIENTGQDVARMINIVRKGRASKRTQSPKPKISITVNCRTMDDLREALQAFGR